MFLPAFLYTLSGTFSCQAYVDSGAAGNFVDKSIAKSYGLSPVHREIPLSARAVDGRPISPWVLTSSTSPVLTHIDSLHEEEISFLIIVILLLYYVLKPP